MTNAVDTLTHPAAPAVELRGLHKQFGSKVAVAAISLDIPWGCFYGLVGPNGAGKTTTLRMTTGLLRPDSGTARVAGRDVWADPRAVKASIGMLPEPEMLFDRLTGRELLLYCGMLRNLQEDVVRERSDALLGLLDLADSGDELIVDYSKGMAKKIALASSILHAPRVLFLDEPFEAIDPVSTRTIQHVLDAHVAAGGSVVFSSHVMAVVERICDRVAVVHEGAVVIEGEIAAVRDGRPLEDIFVEAVGGSLQQTGGLPWLASSHG